MRTKHYYLIMLLLMLLLGGNSVWAESTVKISDGTYDSEYTVTETAVVDGKSRNLAGKFTFTGEGNISGGTVIDDVPGIRLTIGKEGDEGWSVVPANNLDGSYNLGDYAVRCTNTPDRTQLSTTGYCYDFTPYVNGVLTVRYYKVNRAHLYKNKDKNTNVNIDPNRVQEYTFNVIAGSVYSLAPEGTLYLNSFTFRPAFLEVDQSTGELTNTEASKVEESPYNANMNTAADRFPHLITADAGEGMVKFSGERTIVNLATNNNVTLLSDGTTMIKGTVLHENNVDELFTYYYLKSNILKLESVNRLASGSSTAASISDQDYIAESDLENGYLVFNFSSAITRTDAQATGKVYFKALGSTESNEGAGEWIDITKGWTNMEDASNGNFKVKIGALVEGRTYQINIKAGAVSHTTDATLQNSEILFTFTVTKVNEARVKMIYPTGTASVATSIVLEASTSDGSTGQNVDDSKVVTGVLTAEGSNTGMEITAFYDGRNLIFKPSNSLNANTDYTLKIVPTQIYLKNNECVTEVKEFNFTTGAAAGTEPLVVAKTPTDAALVSVGNGTISFTFNQDVELEPYSHMYATPINGSEATAKGTSNGLEENSWKLKKIDSHTIGFDYSDDDLKYDMYYEVVLTANTVTGVGGKANRAATIRFKVNPAPGYTESDDYNFDNREGYPYTWDLTNMKAADIETIKSKWTKNGNNRERPDMYNCYGKELSAATAIGEYARMDDLRGIRITTAHDRSARRIKIGDIDNPSSRYLRFEGNTHYMTIPNVPKSEDNANGEHFLYIQASVSNNSNSVLALNCPTEMAEWVGDAPKPGDSKKVFKIRIKNNGVTADGYAAYSNQKGRDIPLVCSNVSIYKIAYSIYNKTLTSGGEGYATDSHNYNSSYATKGTDYEIIKVLDGAEVTPYYVSAVAGGTSTEAGTVTLTRIPNGVAAKVGVVLKGTAGTTFPLFATAFSKAITNLGENDNFLSGVQNQSVNLVQDDSKGGTVTV